MTNREAVASKCEPYSPSENAIEAYYTDACGKYAGDDIDSDYSVSNIKTVNYAAMLCLCNFRPLTNENLGGISQSYDVAKIDRMIKALAAAAGLDASELLATGDIPTIKFL